MVIVLIAIAAEQITPKFKRLKIIMFYILNYVFWISMLNPNVIMTELRIRKELSQKEVITWDPD